MNAVVLIGTLAVWLPVMAQQPASPPTPAATDSAKTACTCCEHLKNPGKEAQGDSASKACCQNKNGASAKSKSCCTDKEMAGDRKDDKDMKTAMTCCTSKDGKMCSKKYGKGCCGKDAMACNGKEGKNCCAGEGQTCLHAASQS
jgi:hypothetical protein